jgi:5-oxoprolinase (ATP-hydrolysing) subunit A
MMPDGSLAPRTHPGALLDSVAAARQAVHLATSGRFDTICVHGDGKNAAETAAAVRQALRDAGVETKALAQR